MPDIGPVILDPRSKRSKRGGTRHEFIFSERSVSGAMLTIHRYHDREAAEDAREALIRRYRRHLRSVA